eukprot:1141098-Pelagomonas_calceolata.AAC.1
MRIVKLRPEAAHHVNEAASCKVQQKLSLVAILQHNDMSLYWNLGRRPEGPLGGSRIFGVDLHLRPLWAGRPPIDFYHRKNLFGIRNS